MDENNDSNFYRATKKTLLALLPASLILFTLFIVLLVTNQEIDMVFRVASGVIWSLTLINLILFLVLCVKYTMRHLVCAKGRHSNEI